VLAQKPFQQLGQDLERVKINRGGLAIVAQGEVESQADRRGGGPNVKRGEEGGYSKGEKESTANVTSWSPKSDFAAKINLRLCEKRETSMG